MRRYREHAIFAMNVLFALISITLLALDLVKAEAALTNGEMVPLSVTAATTGL